MKTEIPLTRMFADVLRWNIMFGVPVPDDNTNQMLALLQEEFNEYWEATHDSGRVDALGDMIVVALGACARLVHKPYRCEYLTRRMGQAASKFALDRYSLQGVIDSIGSGTNPCLALSEFLELIFIHCHNAGIDIVPVFDNIMKANYSKYWTEEELKTIKSTDVVLRVGGIVVKNKSGKVIKPPSFVHP